MDRSHDFDEAVRQAESALSQVRDTLSKAQALFAEAQADRQAMWQPLMDLQQRRLSSDAPTARQLADARRRLSDATLEESSLEALVARYAGEVERAQKSVEVAKAEQHREALRQQWNEMAGSNRKALGRVIKSAKELSNALTALSQESRQQASIAEQLGMRRTPEYRTLHHGVIVPFIGYVLGNHFPDLRPRATTALAWLAHGQISQSAFEAKWPYAQILNGDEAVVDEHEGEAGTEPVADTDAEPEPVIGQDGDTTDPELLAAIERGEVA